MSKAIIPAIIIVGLVFLLSFNPAFADPLTLFHTTFEGSFPVGGQATFPSDVAFNSDGTKMFVVGDQDAEVNEYTLSTAFDVSTASFVDVFSVLAQDFNPQGVAFNSDGTKMFVLSNFGDAVYEYTLSTAFDLTDTVTFVVSFSVAGQETDPTGVAFSIDGTKMFVVGTTGDDVNEYTLSTAFDLTDTVTFVDSFSVAANGVNTPMGMAFSSDGTEMFVVGFFLDVVQKYRLTTAFDVSTASFVDSFSLSINGITAAFGVAFSSDGTKMFIVNGDGDNVNEYTLTTPFTLSHTAFEHSFPVAGQEADPTDAAFSTDGTKMFVLGDAGDDVNEYTLSSAFDVSTALFVDSFSVVGQETFPEGLAFSSDGTKMFVTGTDGDDVNEYTLSTAFDLTDTVTFVVAFDVSGQETSPQGLAFSSNGFKMFVIGEIGDAVHEYTLSTAFDLTDTVTFVDSFDVSGQSTTSQGLAFSSDGTEMFVVGLSGNDVNEYTLTTGFDVSTASFVASFDVTAQDTIPAGVAFSSDGTKMFVVGFDGVDVNEYTLAAPFTLFHTTFEDSFSVTAQDTSPTGVAFSSDGTKMFVTGTDGHSVHEYTLSTPFDVIDTVTFVVSFDVTAQDSTPMGVAFSSDGTEMFVVGASGVDVNEYRLTTAFDLTDTVTFVDSFDVSGEDTFPTDVAFSSDGTKMFVVGEVGTAVNEYTLSTPFDLIDTVTFVDSFDVGTEENLPHGVAFSSDGTKMFVTGQSGDEVNQYTLSTGFDVSTALFVEVFGVDVQDSSPQGLAFNSGGTKMFVVGQSIDAVYEYHITSLCSPPPSGPWTVSSTCTMTGDRTANGDVIVPNGVVLTVPNTVTLDINFAVNNLTVESGGGVLIESGGKIT